MIVPDANLLLYATDSTSPFHEAAREWWTGCLNGAVPVGLCHPVVFAFARISTNRRAFRQPLSLAQAAEVVQSWCDSGSFSCVLYPGPQHVRNVLELLDAAGSHGGKLVTDAQNADLANVPSEPRCILRIMISGGFPV